MDAVDLDTPMSTLRNLASLSKEKENNNNHVMYNPILAPINLNGAEQFEHDPVSQGILTMEEAQHAFDM
jgi:hypothetical protein